MCNNANISNGGKMYMFWDTFYELCKIKGTKPTPVSDEIGISRSTIVNWKKGAYPTGATLIKLSNYFEVSADYLLGLTDDANPHRKDVAANNVQTVSGGEVGTMTQNNGCPAEITALLSQLSASDRLRATADIMDLIEYRYISKNPEQGDKV